MLCQITLTQINRSVQAALANRHHPSQPTRTPPPWLVSAGVATVKRDLTAWLLGVVGHLPQPPC
jgi:hypothetical protein